ncbi:hypothetical protein D3C81_969590 [compost metagenome]
MSESSVCVPLAREPPNTTPSTKGKEDNFSVTNLMILFVIRTHSFYQYQKYHVFIFYLI